MYSAGCGAVCDKTVTSSRNVYFCLQVGQIGCKLDKTGIFYTSHFSRAYITIFVHRAQMHWNPICKKKIPHLSHLGLIFGDKSDNPDITYIWWFLLTYRSNLSQLLTPLTTSSTLQPQSTLGPVCSTHVWSFTRDTGDNTLVRERKEGGSLSLCPFATKLKQVDGT